MRQPYFRLLGEPGSIPALDGVRGIAILMVVLYHAAESFRPPTGGLLPVVGWDLATPLYSGWLGVNLFFVLSGFLITWHLLRRWTPEVGGLAVSQYLTMRWLRIVPTYYVVLFIAAFELTPHHPIEPGQLGLRITYHLLFLQDYLPGSILGPLWSLGVEEKFYLAMPVVLLLVWRLTTLRRRLALLAGFAAMPLVVRLAMWAADVGNAPESYVQVWRNPFHLNLDALFLGAMAAWIVVHRHSLPRISDKAARWLVVGGVSVVIALTILPAPLQAGELYSQVLEMPVAALGMSAALLGIALSPPGNFPVLEGRWLARAGKLAYPWYLSHVLVMWWAWGELRAGFPGIAELAPAVQLAVFLPVYLTGSILAALVLHFSIEKPGLVLKERVGARRTPAPAPVQASSA